jgi:hypothetical protein
VNPICININVATGTATRTAAVNVKSPSNLPIFVWIGFQSVANAHDAPVESREGAHPVATIPASDISAKWAIIHAVVDKFVGASWGGSGTPEIQVLAEVTDAKEALDAAAKAPVKDLIARCPTAHALFCFTLELGPIA